MNTVNPYETSQASPTGLPPVLDGYSRPPDAIESLIPYRNGPALIAYYTGLFSLCPVIGLPLAVTALVLGVMGLKKRRRQPEVKGAAHAWVGIIVGTLGLLINLLIVSAIVAALVAAMMR